MAPPENVDHNPSERTREVPEEMDSTQSLYDLALFDTTYQYREHFADNAVDQDHLNQSSPSLPTQSSSQLASNPFRSATRAAVKDVPDHHLAQNMSMVDYIDTSSSNHCDGSVDYSVEPNEWNDNHFATSSRPTHNSSATTCNDYPNNRYHNHDGSSYPGDFFSSSATATFLPQSPANLPSHEMAFFGMNSHQDYDPETTINAVYTYDPRLNQAFGLEMAGSFANDIAHGLTSPVFENSSTTSTDYAAHGSTSMAAGDDFASIESSTPETAKVVPTASVQRNTTRQVATQRNVKGYFHGLKGRDCQNEHNIGRHWSNMRPGFGRVLNRQYELHEMVAMRWGPYRWTDNHTNDSAKEFLAQKPQEEQDNFHNYWVPKYEEDRRNDVSTVLRKHKRTVGRLRAAETQEERRLAEERRKKKVGKIRRQV